MRIHKGRPVVTKLLPGDSDASPFPTRPVVDPELIRQAAARIVQPDPSEPTLLVAAFQSSI